MPEEKVIVTGHPQGQTIVHCGIAITPGSRVTVSRKDATAYGRNIIVVQAVAEQLEVPKPEKRLMPADVLPKNKSDLAQRAGTAAAGRIDDGGQKRTK